MANIQKGVGYATLHQKKPADTSPAGTHPDFWKGNFTIPENRLPLIHKPAE
ncbi:MAG: hypothetical protein Q4A21_02370 [bacterium]|nr:hypothetical protein [bacterium]